MRNSDQHDQPHKIPVANRGEIAIRAFRAANQLGISTVAVHTLEDRQSLHRTKADEAYEIGERGSPLRGYLDVDAIIQTALASGADTNLPGLRLPEREPRARGRMLHDRYFRSAAPTRRRRPGRARGPADLPPLPSPRPARLANLAS